MSDQFYRAFEEKFRGSRALIQQRLEVYLPFVNLIQEENVNAKVVDLGCGRGEWLELLKNNGITASGVVIRMRIAITINVYGFSSAVLTIHILNDPS